MIFGATLMMIMNIAMVIMKEAMMMLMKMVSMIMKLMMIDDNELGLNWDVIIIIFEIVCNVSFLLNALR